LTRETDLSEKGNSGGKDGRVLQSGKTLLTTARNIEDLFRYHTEDLGRVMELARKVRETIRVIDPFIQQHTSAVCPQCRQVCCINKHAYYECDDLIYIYALGLEPHEYEYREDREPCQFLAAEGCKLDRTLRPSGCNWFFCDSLYDSLEKTPPKAYAVFDAALQELADLWMELAAEFRVKFRTIKGTEIGSAL
jgi:hypothetical protein